MTTGYAPDVRKEANAGAKPYRTQTMEGHWILRLDRADIITCVKWPTYAGDSL
jgi:hypothetical protein